ncbi:MAG: VCBS repeat-containing protein, partial [Acidobacteriota bacterium]
GGDRIRDRRSSTASGLEFTHWNGRTGALYFPEMTGQGAALFDADGDGDLDAYMVQGTWLRPEDRGKTLEKAPRDRPMDRFFRNEGVRDGLPRFVDATADSGLRATGYGMGVATGDVDGDGHADLYVANYGKDQLWRSRGDGTFEDWTERSGIAGDAAVGGKGWSIGGTFADFDRDGDLDLFVLDYVRFDIVQNPTCYANSSRRDYCGPASFKPAVNRFYRNRGDGTFEDASLAAGVGSHAGASLGVVAADLDADGWLDLYVANDGQENNFWRNAGDGTFSDEALLAGVAFNREGQPEASMGVAVGDFDNDRDLDLFLTHLMGETNTLGAARPDSIDRSSKRAPPWSA